MFSISRLQEVMKGIPRGVFDAAVREHGTNKHSKGFRSWDQLTAMAFAQLSGASSLRVVEAAYNSQPAHHYHLGTGAIRRSTLADANRKRSPEPLVAVVQALMSQVNRSVRKQSARALYLLDSTSLTLKGRHFDAWTAASRNRCTQGMKLHVVYARDAASPVRQSLSMANVNDVTDAIGIPIESETTYVFDKGYSDYNWWASIDASQATFVTRFKNNAALVVDRARPIDADDKDTILADEIVRFAHKSPGGKRGNRYEAPLRRITVARPDKLTPLVLATNDLTTTATVIAQHYKDRWNIELFFKWMKQHLQIKRFFGCNENAVKTQVLCALIVYLLLSLYRKAHAKTASLWLLLAELRHALFQRAAVEQSTYRRCKERRLEVRNRQALLFT
jgi:IS4 transposase